MRWFAAFWLTVLLMLLAGVVLWLTWSDRSPVAVLLQGVIPAEPPHVLVGKLVSLAAVGLFALLRVILQRAIAYTDSATEASPRGEPGFWASVGRWAIDAFHNPTGRWLSPYTAFFVALATFTGPLVWLDRFAPADRTWLIAFLSAMTTLYAATLTLAGLFPDRPMPLRDAPDEYPLDPILHLPGEPPPGPAPAPGP